MFCVELELRWCFSAPGGGLHGTGCRCKTSERFWTLSNTCSVLNYVCCWAYWFPPHRKKSLIRQAPDKHAWCILSFTWAHTLVWSQTVIFNRFPIYVPFFKNLFDAQCSVFYVHFWINASYQKKDDCLDRDLLLKIIWEQLHTCSILPYQFTSCWQLFLWSSYEYFIYF